MQIIHVDSVRGELAAESPENLPNLATPDNLAYVLYTSGSTGKPKGVMISHRAVCNQTAWFAEAYELGPADRVLQIAPLSFDASVPEVFAALAAGSQIVLPPPGLEADPAGLTELMANERVTFVAAVPTLLQTLVDEPGLSKCVDLRTILCGGESVPSALEAQTMARTSADVYCGWGLTEAAIDSTRWRCGPSHGRSTVPIGRPITNTQLYVLDCQLEPVPIGVTGEIFVGGTGLARGYLADAELTAFKFLPNPWGTPGSRIFRTGDLGRWMENGNLECLGRRDHQIKLRGLRIELGEIESVLRRHPAVLEASVLAQGVSQGDRHLVAYVVSRSNPPPATEELVDFLQCVLPPYMVPAHWVWLEAMPHMPSGKIDRSRLPELRHDEAAHAGEFVAPRTPLEELVAGIWSELLGLQHVGIHDNFFRLGGHSLLAMRLVAHLQSRLGLTLPVRALFERPSIAQLVPLLLEYHAGRAASSQHLARADTVPGKGPE